MLAKGIIYKIFQGEVQVESQTVGPNDVSTSGKSVAVFDEDRGMLITGR